VTFVLDRAGVTGPDGASHHGMWDLAMLQIVPGIKIASPRDELRLKEELAEAVAINDAPTVIRFPKGTVANELKAIRRLSDGVDVLYESPSKDVLIMSVGALAETAMQVAKMLADQGIGATVVDPRWVIPVPESIVKMSAEHRLVVTLEDGIRVGGIGTRVRQDLRAAQIDTALSEIGLPDEFLEHASRAEILERVGLTAQSISREIVAQVLGSRVPHARPVPGEKPLSGSPELSSQE
jgi:1-deoxy-D-xylulose-5-phosphate synthase